MTVLLKSANSMKLDCSELRVLLIGPYPPPFGGIASLFVNLIPELKRYSAQDIAVLHFGNVNKIEYHEEALIYRYNLKSQLWLLMLPWNWNVIYKTLKEFWRYKLSVIEIIKLCLKTIIVNKISCKHQSNVVSFYESNASLEILSCKKIWGKKRGITLQIFGEIYEKTSSKFIKKRIDLFKKILEIPDILTSPSKHCANSFKSILDREVEIIYSGVDLNRFSGLKSLRLELRKKMNYSDEIIQFLFLGRFHPDMGLDKLIEAIPKVIENNQKVKFILAGASGPLVSMALDFEKENPNYITILNDIPFEQITSLYAAADIVCTPSLDHRACMGLTIKEAMATSLPAIGTNSGGIPEAIINNETGFIVSHKEDGNIDVTGYVEAMIKLVNSQELRKSMGKNARLRAEQLFSKEVTVQKTADVFLRCIPNN